MPSKRSNSSPTPLPDNNPEGTSGIINIVLKKNAKKGFHASFSQASRYGKHLRYDGSLNSNYDIDPFNFFANASYQRGKREMSGEISRLDNGSTLSQKPLNKVHSYLLKTGFDFYLNDKNTFFLYTRQNLWKTRETNAINATYNKGNCTRQRARDRYQSGQNIEGVRLRLQARIRQKRPQPGVRSPLRPTRVG